MRSRSVGHGSRGRRPYVRSPGGGLLSISGPDGVFYHLPDASGNIIGIIDASGNVDWYLSKPFGEVVEEPASSKYNPYRYKAAYRDVVNGKVLYYMINRYYDPEIGRFTQTDPISGFASFSFAASQER
ncbi:MAG: hypothetical protein FJ319_07420 [SAR202 cluster bacterium]|nr:hypothetical protein [SAR202 cluster bacterium]